MQHTCPHRPANPASSLRVSYALVLAGSERKNALCGLANFWGPGGHSAPSLAYSLVAHFVD